MTDLHDPNQPRYVQKETVAPRWLALFAYGATAAIVAGIIALVVIL